jgi:hypothetical protein
MRMRALPSLAALVLGAATAFLVACGSDGRIPAGNASSLESALAQVSSSFDAGRCQAAEQAVTKLNGALINLPDSVDARLRSRLRSGITHLGDRVQATCGQAQTSTQETPTDTTTTDTTTTDTTTTETTTTDTTGTGTTGTDTTGTGTTSTGATTGATTTGTGTTGTTTGGGTGGTPPGGGAGT